MQVGRRVLAGRRNRSTPPTVQHFNSDGIAIADCAAAAETEAIRSSQRKIRMLPENLSHAARTLAMTGAVHPRRGADTGYRGHDLFWRTILLGVFDAHGHILVGATVLSANLLSPLDGEVKHIASLQTS